MAFISFPGLIGQPTQYYTANVGDSVFESGGDYASSNPEIVDCVRHDWQDGSHSYELVATGPGMCTLTATGQFGTLLYPCTVHGAPPDRVESTAQSLKAQLFIAIQERINSIQTNGNPVFPYIDREMGQLENYVPGTGALPPVSFPCALIELDNFEYKEVGSLVETGTGIITIRIGFPPFSGTSSITPTDRRDEALQYYELENKIFKHLHGWVPNEVAFNGHATDLTDTVGALIRVKDFPEKRTDFIQVQVIVFTVGFEDYTNQLTATPAAKPAPNISGGIN